MVKNAIKPSVEFTTFTAPEKTNPYAADVEKLAAVGSEDAAIVITVDANAAVKEQFKFQKAANAINKTARLRNTDDSGAKVVGKTESGKPVYEGVVKLTFTLTAKHKARRGKNGDAE